jgi:hypothetical protein
MTLQAERGRLGPARRDTIAGEHLKTRQLPGEHQIGLLFEDDPIPENLGDLLKEGFVLADIPIADRLDMEAAEAGVEKLDDRLGVPPSYPVLVPRVRI